MLADQLLDQPDYMHIIIPGASLVLGFMLGFVTRWYFFSKKAHNDLVNNLVSEVECALSVVFEEAVLFTEKYHNDPFGIAQKYITIRQQLMISRLKHIKKLIGRLSALGVSGKMSDEEWTEFRRASDRVFDQPQDTTNLAQLDHSIHEISTIFQKIK